MMALAYTQTQQIWILFFAVLLQSIMAFMDTGFDEGESKNGISFNPSKRETFNQCWLDVGPAS